MDIKKIYGDIGGFPAQKLTENAKPQQASAVRQDDPAQLSQGDKVALSAEARLLGAAMSSANLSPDVRAEKVRTLKEQVQAGTYKPDIRKAAANLIRDDLSLLK